LIKCPDNSHILDLIEGKVGIASSLNEECLLPKTTDLTFASKLTVAMKKNKAFSFSVFKKDEFTIAHYAGDVTYNVAGFLERNKDTLPEALRQLMAGSSNKLLSQLFSIERTSAGTPVGELFATVGASAEVDTFLRGSRYEVASALLLALPSSSSSSSPGGCSGKDSAIAEEDIMLALESEQGGDGGGGGTGTAVGAGSSGFGSGMRRGSYGTGSGKSIPGSSEKSNVDESPVRGGSRSPSASIAGAGAGAGSSAVRRKSEGTRGKITNTLILQFKSQLTKLMALIGETEREKERERE
jgi:hypothetical protein